MLTQFQYRKEEIPPSCWGKKKKQRDDARALLAQHCAYSLRTRRRKVVDTKWRDDGVGYSWEKMAARDVEDPARVALDAEPSVAPQRATPVPVQDPSNAHGVANEVVSLKDELVTTVPWPAELATNDMRSRNNDDLDRWKLENLKQAARLDQSGRSTRSVKFRGGKLGLIIISKPLREGAMGDTLDGRKRWIATLSRSSSSTAKEPSNPSRSPHKSAHRSQPPYSLPADSSSAYVPVSIEAPPQKRQRVDPQVQEDPAPPALAPDAESATLRSLRAQIQQKLIDIDRWTNLLKDYPDFPVKKQVERTQGEVFELQAAIDTERARPGSGA